ncbi:MAG: protein-glutamate O-methyltransferase CheR [Clostridia bacterium]|nr:protein-glutamate O-methyltransferase CheR [Clostridia bacterium]
MISLTQEEFEFIVNHIKTNFGVNLANKRPLIEGRLGNYVADLGFNNYMDYFQFAIKDTTRDEMVNLINKLTTNHTYFLRESDHFDFYKNTVLPWVDKELHDNDLRVWSAGCSSGQEPYTLAMITLDYLGNRAINWDSTILASDISNKVLKIGKEGLYTTEELADVPPNWLEQYFTKVGSDSYQVTPLLRKNVAFRNLNLLSPFSFKKQFHAIFCRNVMIYFDTPTKNEIIAKYYEHMLPGGYFFIGHSESLSACTHSFEYVMPSIYRKPL